jgi:hypothetical protein
MSSPSNLYAEKIFSEHPLALWSFDDKADYISIISEAQRDMSTWTTTGGTAELVTNIIDEPFPTSKVSLLTGELTDDQFGEIESVSPNLINFSDLNQSLGTFSVSSYINASTSYLHSISIGYEYYDTTSGDKIQNLRTFTTSINERWIFVSETFDIPSDITSGRMVIKVRYLGNAETQDNYRFWINGLTFGQWSEEFHSTSLGVTPITIPQNIATSMEYGIPAFAYGLQENNGYYFVKDSALIAKNSSIPMVYGASNLTTISPNNPEPSLIVPGYGFLNNIGKNKEYTFEAWVNINSNATIKKRVIGPIGSDDGLYVDGPFLGLKISDNYATHFIGEWVRPMLIHIRIIKDNASLLINGEEVLSLNFFTSDLVLPDVLNEDSKNQDWIGFYSYDDIFPFQVDCVAIYPYQVPSIVAKRRLVYGQGVEFPENINTAYSGTSVFIDYPFADYTNNYSYPDIGNWSQGIIDNLSTQENILSTPNYELPSIVFSNKTELQFYSDNSSIQDESDLFYKLKPNSSWNSSEGYLLFENLNFLQEGIKCFYGVFKAKSISLNKEILFHIESINDNNSFTVYLDGSDINYVLKYNGIEETIYNRIEYEFGDLVPIGLNIDNFSNYFGGNVSKFFGNRGNLRLFVGGKSSLENTFSGNIYKVGFANAKNFEKISSLFNIFGVPTLSESDFYAYLESTTIEDAGFVDSTWSALFDGGTPSSFITTLLQEHVSSYTLVAKEYFGNYSLDIDIAGTWSDYLPLTYFAQYVTDEKGDKSYDLDFLQINLNYPSPSVFIEEQETNTWTYGELRDEYGSPIQRTYASLDDQLFTGYNNYSDLQNRSSKSYNYDTSNALVRSYISFQRILDGSNANNSYFTSIRKPPKDNIVQPDTNWPTTKYEVVSNMIVYPPAYVNFNDISLVFHLDFKVEGILNKKVGIRSLEVASQALNNSSNPVGTRFGVPIYPYKKSGIYFDYKGKNPFTIYKGSTPYLYLTRYSGIQLSGNFDPLINRGLSIPINQTKADNYKVMALQTAVRYDQDFFPYAPIQIFEIESKNSLIKFYMVANNPDGKRAKIYAINSDTGELEDGIAFYWNGNLVKEPSITVKEWGFLGVSFSNILDFKNVTGALRVNGPLMVNNISHYQSTNLQEVQQIEFRPWFQVKYSGLDELDWNFWNPAYLWQGVLVLSSASYYGVDPSDIYKSYTGTNKIIVDDEEVFGINGYEYSVYQNILWQQSTINAV